MERKYNGLENRFGGFSSDEEISLAGHDPEDVLRALLKVDPEAPPAKRNADEPVEEPEPLKDQGDPLSG